MEGGYNDIDPGLNPALQDHYRITPSPGGPGDQYGMFVTETGRYRYIAHNPHFFFFEALSHHCRFFSIERNFF